MLSKIGEVQNKQNNRFTIKHEDLVSLLSTQWKINTADLRETGDNMESPQKSIRLLMS